MKYRPYIVSGPHAAEVIKAYIDGSKTQFREPMKLGKRKDGCQLVPELLQQIGVGSAAPRGNIGDRLYTKEAIEADFNYDFPILARYAADKVLIEIRNCPDDQFSGTIDHWRLDNKFYLSAPFMPRDYSRITLEITGIRVERLNEISEEDAIKEGVKRFGSIYDHKIVQTISEKGFEAKGTFFAAASHAFQSQWESQHGPGSFDNRWTWVYDVKRVKN